MFRLNSDTFFIRVIFCLCFLLIFNVWSIDFNGEEVFIAFSFFILVLSFFLFFNKLIRVFFLTRVNIIYNMILDVQESLLFSYKLYLVLLYKSERLFAKGLYLFWRYEIQEALINRRNLFSKLWYDLRNAFGVCIILHSWLFLLRTLRNSSKVSFKVLGNSLFSNEL